MALSDYRLCDVCGCKAFYDAKLDYEGETPYLVGGQEQYSTDGLKKYSLCLGNLGDWAVICVSCSKKFRTMIVERSNEC